MPTPARFEVLIATRNAGKIDELLNAFSGLAVTFRSLSEFPNVNEVDEVGTTYEENASLKAAGYADQTGLAALADDSGLEVDALNGQPGIFSARFGGSEITDEQRIEVLLDSLYGLPDHQRTARFVCCMVLLGKSARETQPVDKPCVLAVSQAMCEGSIARVSSGTHGFGFDPVFIPAGYDLPFAALHPAVKANISHRAKAARQMRRLLQTIADQLDRTLGGS